MNTGGRLTIPRPMNELIVIMMNHTTALKAGIVWPNRSSVKANEVLDQTAEVIENVMATWPIRPIAGILLGGSTS